MLSLPKDVDRLIVDQIDIDMSCAGNIDLENSTLRECRVKGKKVNVNTRST